MTRSRYVLVFFGLLLPVLLTGCYKKEIDELKKIDFQSPKSFAVPLFESTLTIRDSLPFSFDTANLSDTVEINLGQNASLGNPIKFDYVEFKIILRNNFAARGEIQFYFADKNGTIIDSLFNIDNKIIDAANGVNFNESTLLVYLDKDKFKKIETAQRIYIRYSLVSSINNFYNSNQIQIYSGVKFGTTF